MATITHSAFGGPVNYSVTYLPDDAEGQVAGTIALMRRYVDEDAASPEIGRDVAEALGEPRGNLTDRQCIERVWAYVNGHLQFVPDQSLTNIFEAQDPAAPIVEALIRPVDMSVMCAGGNCQRVGDCDDHSMYAAALLKRLGIRCAFVTVAADPSAPGQMSHVYVAAYTRDGQRIPVDASHGPYCGWETPDYTRMEEWSCNQPSFMDLVGAGLLAYCLARSMGYL